MMADDGNSFARLQLGRASTTGCEQPQGASTGAVKMPNAPTILHELKGFGRNPGDLRMHVYVPARLPRSPALVVALHGCGQTAHEYDQGTGWSTLAERYGFVVVYPEQLSSNNPRTCFSWFVPDDIARNQGEALSIREMVEHALVKFGLDRRRVFVTGLSAGGAMASVVLATYPEVFAAGTIIAGLPFGSARSVQEAVNAMFSDQSHTQQALGNRVRAASEHRGPWPRISVWHGTADTIVKPSNAEHSVNQWIDVHGLATEPSRLNREGGHTHREWYDAEGRVVLESFVLQGMGHGVPLGSPANAETCGKRGQYFIEVGLCSSLHSVKAWGLDADLIDLGVSRHERAHYGATPSTDDRSPAAHPSYAAANANPEPVHRLGARSADRLLDAGSVIAAAFKAAGLSAPSWKGDAISVKGRVHAQAIIDAALKAAGLKSK